ncbi:methyltransferase type 11 domain protein [Mycobacterium xenopi 4042]|uniref:Methyltransferase type 11 domain protein n=1 Tax=Mycobacterium xenopi 4042 TaxID=1299334 RepID=X8AJJ7_MYCXE|nr:methyltransferase type 11 domain protein [Mycobacterium xenopi 4042]
MYERMSAESAPGHCTYRTGCWRLDRAGDRDRRGQRYELQPLPRYGHRGSGG